MFKEVRVFREYTNNGAISTVMVLSLTITVSETGANTFIYAIIRRFLLEFLPCE